MFASLEMSGLWAWGVSGFGGLGPEGCRGFRVQCLGGSEFKGFRV